MQLVSAEVDDLYFSLFPRRNRAFLQTMISTRRCGAPEWFYLLQEAGNSLRDILTDLVAAYLAAKAIKAQNDEHERIIEILLRVRKNEITEYSKILRRVETASLKDATVIAREVAGRHGEIMAILRTRRRSKDLIAIIERLESHKKANVASKVKCDKINKTRKSRTMRST